MRLLLAIFAALLVAPASASAIVNGHAPTRDYPFMTSLRYDDSHICGASLVAPEWVLTAGHCVTESDGSVTEPSQFKLQIGGVPRVDSFWNSASERGEVIEAAEVIRHADYDDFALTNDVALIRLARPSKYAPIALASPATQKSLWEPGDEATVIGYGGPFYQTPSLRGKLKQVEVPIVEDAECAAAYNERSFELTGTFDATTMVCAGNLYGTEDSCQGDSGGPLFVPTGEGDEIVQAGVVSWGFACGLPNFYGVYARVGDEPLNSWVQQRIAPPTSTKKKSRKPAARKRSSRRR